jgi:hypothetical protein
MPQDRHYTGAFSHPCFGKNDIPIEVTLYGAARGGQWKCMNQIEEVAVQRHGKDILIADLLGATAFEGKEVVGGMLIGTVVQNGEHGGKFVLHPCTKSPTGTAFVMRTCVQKQQVHIPVITEVTPGVQSALQALFLYPYPYHQRRMLAGVCRMKLLVTVAP